uniref:Condensin complex subunit 2 n=1 Tax=Schistocephalus solidus TaxID=70667 RepID=A0A0X3P478_SCHSO
MASPPFLPDDDDDDVGPMEVTKVEEQEQVAHYASEPTSKAAAVSEQSSVNGDGEVFVSSLKSMLSTHLENFGQINDGILGLWAGPEHWRKKAKRRRLDEFGNVACQPEGEGEVVEMGRSTRSKVAKKKLLRIDYSNALLTAGENRAKSGLLVRSDWSKQLAGFSAKSTKSALLKEQNRRLASEKFNVLPPAICDARKHLYELCNRDVMQASHPKKTPEEAVPPWLDGQVPNANGTEYMTLDDVTRLNDVDGGCVDDDDDDNDAPFCGIFTQATGGVNEDVEDMPDGALGDFEGGELDQVELVSQPRQVARLEIGYARSAKLINVRHLKNIMWNMIDAALPDPEACPEGSQLPVKATKLAQSAVVDGTDIVAAASPLCDFGQILTALPGRVSRNTAEELSVAITLNCLLHLANEKDLMFEPMEDFTNLAIYRGLTDSELELLKEYEKAVRSERRRDKQLSLDAWLEADD